MSGPPEKEKPAPAEETGFENASCRVGFDYDHNSFAALAAQYRGLRQADIDWLVANGVSVMSMIRPMPLRLALGRRAADGWFEHDDQGHAFFVFEESSDLVFWNPATGELATWWNRAFAIGEAAIDEAATYSFDCALNVFPDPLSWLQAKRDGVVVLDWERAFDRLRDCPRIAVDERILPAFRRWMRAPEGPGFSCIAGEIAA